MKGKGYKLTNNRIRDMRDRIISNYLIRCQLWRDSHNTHDHASLDLDYAQKILFDIENNLIGLYMPQYHWLRYGLTGTDRRRIAQEAVQLHKQKIEIYPWYREGIKCHQ